MKIASELALYEASLTVLEKEGTDQGPGIFSSRSRDMRYGKWVLTGSRLGPRPAEDALGVAAALEMASQAVLVHSQLRAGAGRMQQRTLTGDLLLAHSIARLAGKSRVLTARVLEVVETILETEFEIRQGCRDAGWSMEKQLECLERSLPMLDGFCLSIGGALSGMGGSGQASLMQYGIYWGIISEITREILEIKPALQNAASPKGVRYGLLTTIHRAYVHEAGQPDHNGKGLTTGAQKADHKAAWRETLKRAGEIQSMYRCRACACLRDFQPCPALDYLHMMLDKA